MSHTKPKAHAAAGRVSQTATADQSPSTAVWRLLENDPKFVEGMDRARADFDAGRTTPTDYLKGRRRK
jgi:hypothetical protein